MRWTRRPWQQGEISAYRHSLPAGINAQAYRERDSHVCVPAVATWTLALEAARVPPSVLSVFGLKFDDGVSFRLLSSQVGRIGVAPIRKIYNPRYLSSAGGRSLGSI
jgi:hypothetical protein